MAKYAAVKMGKGTSLLKRFMSASAAQKYRTKMYKSGYKTRIGIIGQRGWVGPRTYGKLKSVI